MSDFLDTNNTKYQIRIGNRILAEATSKTAIDILLNQLSEHDKMHAVVIPVDVDGRQVLLG